MYLPKKISIRLHISDMGRDISKPDKSVEFAFVSSFDTCSHMASWIPEDDMDIHRMYIGKII